MTTEHLIDDIRDMNLSYLLLVQRLVTTDRELAKFRLKIDDEMAGLLATIPLADLSKLAQCSQLLCSFSLDDASQLYALINAPKNDDMRRIHAAILLTGPNRRGSGVDKRRSQPARDAIIQAAGLDERRGADRRRNGVLRQSRDSSAQ